ncbi:hypothetical protein Vafri_11992 [Volvox africanus]|uniref:Uncharacterized protein n=1 Tax=Volvox africanus TaxID=51714 RepID=A0A8J4F161_9CHLO|nr:hypothetical protein Vafri_11992 [Volvox africanus]
MKVPVTKTLSSLYLDPPRDAPDSKVPELLPSLGSSPCGTAATTTAVWAGADHGRSSMPHLSPPAARLSLCIDFPGYLQALQHPPQIASTLPPLFLRSNAPAMHLSALYPSAAESSTDPRVNTPVQYSALPPGFSLGSLAGVAKENGGDNGRAKGDPIDGGNWYGGQYRVRASVDAAATAEVLSSWEHGPCLPLTYGTPLPEPPLAAVQMADPDGAAGENLTADNIAGGSPQTLQPAAAPTAEPLPAPWVFPPPPEAAVSQSQVPVQMDWVFDSDLQRARAQARHAVMDALDEIRYEHRDDSHRSSKDGAAEGHAGRAWGCFSGPGTRLCSISNGRSNVGAAARTYANVATDSSGSRRGSPGGKGGAWLLLSAMWCKTLQAAGVDVREQRKNGRAACSGSIRTVIHRKKSSGCRFGGSNRDRSGCTSYPRADVDANGEEEDEEGKEGEGEDVLLVLRSRDSRLVHRVRLAMDVSRGPAGARRSVSSPSSPKAQASAVATTSAATSDLDAALAAAAAIFTAATAEERPLVSGPQPAPTAEADSCRAEGQRRVWFRSPLVERTHWFTRSPDAHGGSSDCEEDMGGKSFSKVPFGWVGLKRPGIYSNGMGRPKHVRSASLTAMLRRGSLSFLSLAKKMTASGRSVQAEQAEAAVDLSRKSVNPCVLAARGVW